MDEKLDEVWDGAGYGFLPLEARRGLFPKRRRHDRHQLGSESNVKFTKTVFPFRFKIMLLEIPTLFVNNGKVNNI